MIIEVLQWAELDSAIKVTEITKRISSFILLLYVISYIFNKKGCLIAAFICCEVWCYGGFSDWASDEMFYGGYAAIYCLLYFYIRNNITQKVTKLSGIVSMILLAIGMSLDASLYPSTKTYFSSSYKINVLLLHIYIIITFINWRILRTYMGESFTALCRIMGINDAFRFYWYNVKNKATQ